jgi:DNA polymerase/3'-5' exonuclease PolX
MVKRADALDIAVTVIEALKGGCDRIEIAGSLRRKRSEVHDVEIVCIPKKVEASVDLFGVPTEVRSPQFYCAFEKWEVLKGSPQHGKYIKAQVQGVAVDVFTAAAENWGWIFTLRTGPADFGHYTIVSQLKRCQYKAVDGFIFRRDKLVPVREEKDLFAMLNLKYIEPEYRL